MAHAPKTRSEKAVLSARRAWCYLVLVLISFLCLFFFYILIVNSTRTHFEIQKGFSLLPGKSMLTNFKNVLADANIPVGIGIRNSHDRTIAVGLAAGLTVCCCSNMCFGGSTVLKRRHTSRIELNGLVLEAVNALELEFLTLENVAEELKIDELNDDEVRASLVVAAERQAIPSCDILTVWKEFKHPRHEEFAEPTRWSLLNAFTETAKKYSPARADQCYRSLTRLFGLDGKPAELWK